MYFVLTILHILLNFEYLVLHLVHLGLIGLDDVLDALMDQPLLFVLFPEPLLCVLVGVQGLDYVLVGDVLVLGEELFHVLYVLIEGLHFYVDDLAVLLILSIVVLLHLDVLLLEYFVGVLLFVAALDLLV